MAIRPQFYCVKCGRHKDKKEFYLNYNKYLKEYNDGRMLYCSSCCKEISQDIMSQYWSSTTNKEDKIAYSFGIRAICTFFTMPYVDKAMNDVRDKEINSIKDKDWNYVYQYGTALKELETPTKYWDDLSGNAFLPLDLLNVAKPTQDGDLGLFGDLEKDWGVQDDLKDYLFLEEKFKTYTQGETLNATMVNTVRYLCQAELDVRKLKSSNADMGEINKAEKRVMDYYSKLKLDDFKFSKQKTLIEQTIEDWALIYESKEPLEWVDEHLEDICKFREDNDEIMRSIGNKCIGNKDYPKLTLEDVGKTKKNKRKKNLTP